MKMIGYYEIQFPLRMATIQKDAHVRLWNRLVEEEFRW